MWALRGFRGWRGSEMTDESEMRLIVFFGILYKNKVYFMQGVDVSEQKTVNSVQ